MPSPSPSFSGERHPIERLAEEFAERLRQGETPALSEYTQKYPEHAEQIRRLFPALALMEQLKPVAGDLTGDHTSLAEQPVEYLGDFQIVREVGRGGMGVVYEAVQLSLGRRVALKVLPPVTLADASRRQRFQREAKAAARLHHTNIVPVYGVGEHEGTCYYVMQFIHGLGLDEVLDELRRLRRHEPSGLGKEMSVSVVTQGLLTGQFEAPTSGAEPSVLAEKEKRDSGVHLPGQAEGSSLSSTGQAYWHSVARIGIQVAEALAYAHGQGVLHRDVKPANLLLDTQGNVWVTDFGLAKVVDSDDLTHTGDVVGTLRYLAPERFQGKADACSDVYALGLTLYELLTLRPAFAEAERDRLLAQVMRPDAARPRQLDPGVPRDLETVVLKAMEPEPGRRYATAQELVDDLRRFLAGEPIHARRVGRLERAQVWAKRKPAEAALVLVSGVAALALVGAAVAWVYSTRLVEEGQRTQEALEWAHFNQYFHHIARVHADWRYGQLFGVDKLLDACPPHRRNWEWHYLKRLCHADLLTLPGHRDEVTSVAFHPDGTQLASASMDKSVRVWDAVTGRLIHALEGHTDIVWGVAFSPDGTRLASACSDRKVRVWDTTTWKKVCTLPAHKDWTVSVAFSPDGRRLAAGGAVGDRTIKVWDTATWNELSALKSHRGGVVGLAFGPDGTRLASSCLDGSITHWDTTTGKEVDKLQGHTNSVWSVSFSPDGTLLASASADRTLRIWDMRTGKWLRTLEGHASTVRRVHHSPDGTRLASASFDGTVKLWDTATGKEIRTFKGHTSGVFSVAFSPDGARLASSGADRTVKVWGVTTSQDSYPQMGHRSPALCVTFSPDGTRLASSDAAGTVRVWDTLTGHLTCALPDHPGRVCSVAFSPDSRRLASAGADARIRVWEIAAARQVLDLACRTVRGQSVAFSPDGQWLAAASLDGSVRIWDAATGRLDRDLVGHTGAVHTVAFSPDSRRVASAGRDNSVRVWDVATGDQVHTLVGHQRWVWMVAFSPGGTLLASASWDGTARVWDAMTGKELRTLAGHTSDVYGLAFNGDGSRLATASQDGKVKVWDVKSGQAAVTLTGHEAEVNSVAFSVDGDRLASAGADGVVRVWDARPLTTDAAVEREALSVLDCLFAKPLRKADVRAYLQDSQLMRPQARKLALTLMDRYREESDPEKYHQAAWAIVQQPYLNAFQYGFALRQATAAGKPLTTLGAAQYRTGQYCQALTTLLKANRPNQDSPMQLAFLAMTQHQLGEQTQAQATLARLRQTMKQPPWDSDDKAHHLLREAESLLTAKPAKP